MKLLLTAFDPFGGESINPAWEAADQLPDEIDGAEILKLTVPTVFGKSIDIVTAAMERLQPDVVLCVGQAGGRAAITVERVAINCMDAAIPDNEGNQPSEEPVRKDGPAAYFSTLPIRKMTEAIQAEGIPAAISNSAGTFVCNQLMYGVLDYAGQQETRCPGKRIRAGFLHVPYIPVQAAVKKDPPPSMALDDMVRGLMAAIRCLTEGMDENDK